MSNQPRVGGNQWFGGCVMAVAMATLTLLTLTAGVGDGVAGANEPRSLTIPSHQRTPAQASINTSLATATSGQIDELTVTPDTVLAGTEITIQIQFSGGSAQEQFGTVITDLNDDFDPFSCSEMLISGTAADGTEEEICQVPVSAYIGLYSAQGVILNPGPPPSVVFSGGDASFTVVASPAITVTTASLPSGEVWSRANHSAYSASLSATGGNPPYKWSLAAGSDPLPPGLKLHKSSGVISGRATTVGMYLFTLQVVDTRTMTKPHTRNTAAKTFTITISQ
ncbi:MAG: Ig domain-containing protein [Acidimicrobiales bacterium]